MFREAHITWGSVRNEVKDMWSGEFAAEQQNGVEPTPLQLFEVCHTHKNESGETVYIDKRAQDVAAHVCSAINNTTQTSVDEGEGSSAPPAIDHVDLYVRIVGFSKEKNIICQVTVAEGLISKSASKSTYSTSSDGTSHFNKDEFKNNLEFVAFIREMMSDEMKKIKSTESMQPATLLDASPIVFRGSRHSDKDGGDEVH